MRVLAGVLMIHHGSEGGLGPANFGTGGEGSPAAAVPAPALATTIPNPNPNPNPPPSLAMTTTAAMRRAPTRQASTVSSRTY